MKINKIGKVYINKDDVLVFEGWDIDGENKYPQMAIEEIQSLLLEKYIKTLREKMEVCLKDSNIGFKLLNMRKGQ